MEGDSTLQQQTRRVTFLEIDAAAGPAASSSAMSSEALLSHKSDRPTDGDAQIPILVAEQLNGSGGPAHRAKSTKVCCMHGRDLVNSSPF